MSIRDNEVFRGCTDVIRKLCYNRFNMESLYMNETERERAAARLACEIDMVINKGSFFIFYLTLLMVEFAEFSHRLFYVGGQSAYSYVAYLLGITYINPITADYPMEFAFPDRGAKWTHMPIVISKGFIMEIIYYLRSLFGNEPFRIEYNTIVIGKPGDEIYIPFQRDDLVTKVDKVIGSKGGWYSSDIFQTEKKAVFSNAYYGLLPEGYESALKAVADARGRNEAISIDAGIGFHTRDDVYRYGLELFEGRSDYAFRLMDMVRKGRGIMMKDLLKEHGADEKTIDQLTHIQYLVYEGDCIPQVQMMAYCMNAN